MSNFFGSMAILPLLQVSESADARVAVGMDRPYGSPVRIAWRGEAAIETAPYAAPFPPTEIFIPVAEFGVGLSRPFVFKSPGGIPPIDCDANLVG